MRLNILRKRKTMEKRGKKKERRGEKKEIINYIYIYIKMGLSNT